MNVADADRITAQLKEFCDPRGHDLVDAIGEVLRSMADALEAIQREAEPDRTRECPACEGKGQHRNLMRCTICKGEGRIRDTSTPTTSLRSPW